jgi:hypothetical protein
MHNGQLADPLNEFSKAIGKISSKRSKTEADHEEIGRLEFLGGLYVKNNKVIIPAEMLEASIIAGAKKFRKGPAFKVGIIVEDHAELNFGSGLKADRLWKHKDKYALRVAVRIQRSKLFRVRPKFDKWSLSFTVLYDPSIVDENELIEAIKKAGSQAGLGDWRPRYGRFKIDSSSN